jgi:hypothetical protein
MTPFLSRNGDGGGVHLDSQVAAGRRKIFLKRAAARAEIDHAFGMKFLYQLFGIAAQQIHRRTGTVDIVAFEDAAGASRLEHAFFVWLHFQLTLLEHIHSEPGAQV